MPLDLLQRRWLRAALLLIVALPVLLIAINGLFMRPIADDWCFIMSAKEHGLFGAPLYYYQTWTATLSSSFVQSAVGLSGPWAVGVLPVLLLSAWWLALTWLAHEVVLWLGLRYSGFLSLFGGTLLLLSILDGLPNLIQAAYWTSGAATYITPTLLLTLILALLVRRLRGVTGRLVLDLAAVATLTTVAGFFAPTYAAVQVTLFVLLTGLLLLAADATQRRALLPLLLTALGVALFVLVVYLTAPGTAIRADANARYREGLSLLDMALQALVFSAGFFGVAGALFSPWTLLLTLMSAGLAGYALLQQSTISRVRQRGRWILLLSSMIIIIIVLSAITTTVVITGDTLPARAFPVVQFPMVLTAAIWGWVMGQGLRRPTQTPSRLPIQSAIALAALLVLGIGLNTLETLQLSPKMQTFQQEWHARDTLLREQAVEGQQHGLAPPFTDDIALMAWIEPLGDDPMRGFNQCAAAYYGFETLRITDES